MSGNKTQPTQDSPIDFINAVEPVQKRKDCLEILKLMEQLSAEKPVVWGGSMVGFGSYHYKYDSGREGDWFRVGFAPRKQNITLYIMTGFSTYPDIMQKLGKFKTGGSCLYIKKLADVDINVLADLIKESLAYMRQLYP